MKPTISQNASPKRNRRSLLALAMLATLAMTVACSGNSKPAVKTSHVADVKLRQASIESAAPLVPATESEKSTAVKQPTSKLTYKSRNYGVSFQYPWQYSYLSAKALANGDEGLRPKSDGHDGQFTLARVDVPNGFYPDTDFDSGYFVLSLNQEISEQECEATLPLEKDAKPMIENVNGVEFRWAEVNSGGRGSASKVRHMVSFTNGTCYELELGVKTKNADGLAREIDPDQVMRRLDGILRSVKIETMNLPAGPKEETASVAQN